MRRFAFASALFAALALAGCGDGGGSSGSGGGGSAPVPTHVEFPPEFLWGGATAGFQVETGLDDTDWGVWAKIQGNIQRDDDPNEGPDAFAHVKGDVDGLVAAGMNAYRFSIEMARVYPTRDAFDADKPDPAGLQAYDELFSALSAKHLTPLVTLHHFVWPSWMSDPTKELEPQGWERADAIDVFATWCDRMGKRYGDRVDWWVTINEPNVEASVGYLATLWPPGVADVDRAATVMKQQVRAHARCYDRLHVSDTVDASGDGTKVKVSIAQHNRVYEPTDPSSDDDKAAAAHADFFWNRWILDAIVLGKLDENFDEKIDGQEMERDPTLAGRADYLGINYYGVSSVDHRSIRLPYVGSMPSQFELPDGRPKNDLGWSIYPEGFGTVLDEAAKYGLPIVVTENGIADSTDSNRSRFTLEHVFQIGLANDRGDGVIGYFHWALMDNFEWASGFCPKFGLYSVDLAQDTKPRTPTKVVPLLHDLTTTRALDQKTIDALPAYRSEPKSCATL